MGRRKLQEGHANILSRYIALYYDHDHDPELLYSVHVLDTAKHWKIQYSSIDLLHDSMINLNKVRTLGKSDEQGPVAVRIAKGRNLQINKIKEEK